MTANPADPALRAASGSRRTLSRSRKLVYGLIVSAVLLLALEGVSRLVMAQVPNLRFEYHQNLVATIGFPGLGEILEPDPRCFWRVKPGLASVLLTGRIGNSAPMTFTVSTDRRGHRLIRSAPAARSTVLFLGDSCTFGVGVNDGESFPALLQELLPASQCINAGVPGYTSYQGRLLYEDLASRDEHDVVVVCFRFNDDSVWDGKSDAEQSALLERENARWVNRIGILNLLAALRPQPPRPPPQKSASGRPRLTDAEYLEQVGLIVRRCRERGGEPVLVVWPARQQMEEPGELSKQVALRRMASQEGVRLVDLVPTFRARRGQFLFVDVVHANSAGNRVVAEALLATLTDVLQQRAAKH